MDKFICKFKEIKKLHDQTRLVRHKFPIKDEFDKTSDRKGAGMVWYDCFLHAPALCY